MRVRTIALIAAQLALLCGCSNIPTVDVLPVVENGQVVFDISHSGIVNGILGLRVEDESGAPLWVVKMSYEKGRTITYGVLPTGGNMTAKQEFPPEDRAPAEICGRTVRVTVEYQYDSKMTPFSSKFSKTVTVPR